VKQLTIPVQPAYDALLGEGLLAQAGALTAEAVRGRHVLIVTDRDVKTSKKLLNSKFRQV
jgi:hypothetical protein